MFVCNENCTTFAAPIERKARNRDDLIGVRKKQSSLKSLKQKKPGKEKNLFNSKNLFE
jgi:hypothetical protein